MKKSKKIITISIVFLLSLFYINTVNATNRAKVTSETVRIREEASTDSAILELISINEEVEIIEKEDDWYKVKYNDITGYIKANLLSLDETEENEEEQSTTEENVQEQENQTEEDEQENKEESTELTVNQEITIKSNLDVKILPLINSSNISTINASTKMQIKEIINDWCYIETDTIQGWIRKYTLINVIEEDDKKLEEQNEKTTDKEETEKTTTKIGYVNVDTVNLRKEMSTSSTILLSLSKNTAVTILGEENNWYNVEVNETKGYIASKYISDKKVETDVTSRSSDELRELKEDDTEDQSDEISKEITTSNNEKSTTTTNKQTTANTSTANTSTADTSTANTSTANTSTTNTSANTESTSTNETANNTSSSTSSSSSITGNDVVAYAKKYLGYKYVYGGSSPSTGFDCSGFTSYVYKHFGISLSRTSSGQRSNGKAVKKSELQPGDIVCFTGHVGIYIGGNQFIHAANATKGVIITSLSDSYYVKNYITARRVL